MRILSPFAEPLSCELTATARPLAFVIGNDRGCVQAALREEHVSKFEVQQKISCFVQGKGPCGGREFQVALREAGWSLVLAFSRGSFGKTLSWMRNIYRLQPGEATSARNV